MTAKGVEALQRLQRKLDNAYYDRLTTGPQDYPPYALTAWDDRARYIAFVTKVIHETIEEEK